MQLAIERERRMTPGSIDRDSDDPRFVFVELGENLVVQRHLIATDRTPVGRIERHDQWSAAEIAQRHQLVGRAMQREIRRRRPRREYLVFSFSHIASLPECLADREAVPESSMLVPTNQYDKPVLVPRPNS